MKPIPSIPWRLIGLLAGLIALVALPALVMRSCDKRAGQAAQGRVNQGEAGAAIGSGAVAVNVVGGVTSNDAATDAAVAQGQADVHAAPEGRKSAATKKAACALRTYRDTPACKEPAR